MPSSHSSTDCSPEGSALRPLRPGDVERVVDIHLGALKEGLVASLGRPFLERALYPALLSPGSSGVGFVQVRQGRVVGFAAGLTDASALPGALLRNRPLLSLAAPARKCLDGPGALQEILEAAGRLLYLPSRRPPARLLFLAVEEDYQGRGLALKLLEAFLERCRRAGAPFCEVGTPAGNLPARRLYEHVGFSLERERRGRDRVTAFYRIDLEGAQDASGGALRGVKKSPSQAEQPPSSA